MRLALSAGLCLLAVLPFAVEDAAEAKDPQPSQSIRESHRARLDRTVVTIMAGGPHGTDLAVVADLAAVLDDGDTLRVVPMVGKGPAQNIKDVMFMRGVDMGITQANVLKHFARNGELGAIERQVAYVAKLFNEEMHVLARADVSDLRALEGKAVNFGAEGSGTEITGRLVFEALGIDVRPVHFEESDAIAKLKAGEIDAAVVVTGKPAPILAHIEAGSGLKLLNVPYADSLVNDYYPGTLTHSDYPALIQDEARVDTVAVCAVLVSFNWASDSPRYRKIETFVERFFSKFAAFQVPPRHPKWREVNFAATLEDWQRSPLAQAWIDRAGEVADADTRARFDTFLAQANANGPKVSEAERADLFRAFLEWSKTQNKN